MQYLLLSIHDLFFFNTFSHVVIELAKLANVYMLT